MDAPVKTNRIALVTGSARGIGYAIADELASRSYVVIVADIDLSAAEQAAGELAAQGYSAKAYSLDVREEASVEDLFGAIRRQHGWLDVLVNNAGISKPAPLEEMDTRAWRDVFAVNLDGAFFCSRAAFPLLKLSESGRIINIASFAGKRGTLFGNNSSYTASKAGLIGLTRALALEAAEYAITVNGVAPGVVATSLLDALSQEQRRTLEANIPLGRLAAPTEVASLVGFLASVEAGYITGEVVNINGGLYMD